MVSFRLVRVYIKTFSLGEKKERKVDGNLNLLKLLAFLQAKVYSSLSHVEGTLFASF